MSTEKVTCISKLHLLLENYIGNHRTFILKIPFLFGKPHQIANDLPADYKKSLLMKNM